MTPLHHTVQHFSLVIDPWPVIHPVSVLKKFPKIVCLFDPHFDSQPLNVWTLIRVVLRLLKISRGPPEILLNFLYLR